MRADLYLLGIATRSMRSDEVPGHSKENTMFRTTRLLMAMAFAAVALPLAAAEAVDAKTAPAVSTDAKSAPATTGKNGAPALTPQEQRLERTGNETRALPPPPKMTAEEKKADKAAKRVAPTKEQQERQGKYYPGG